MKTKTQEAVAHLCEELKRDKNYRDIWESALSMCYYYEYRRARRERSQYTLKDSDIRLIANEASKNFIKLLCDDIKPPEGK